MARTRNSFEQRRQAEIRARTSWTRFYLPRDQDWPTWSTNHSKSRLGPLTGAEGYKKVWLGRKVDDSEQAALIILWESADALKKFKDSPAGDKFLQSLPEKDTRASLISGASLKGLSLNDTDDAKLSSAPSRFLSFQWDSGFQFKEHLEGRITLTALVLPYTDVPNREPLRNAVKTAFKGFLPAGCEDLIPRPVVNPNPRQRLGLYRERFPYMYSSTAWAWVDTGDACADGDLIGENNSGRTVLCEFRRWNGYNGATPEREEAQAKDPKAKESWAQVVANAMPPAVAWEQERWHLQDPPAKEEDEEEEMEEEDAEYNRELNEWLDDLLKIRALI
ncbi:hypothetical protein ACHAQJ_000494 [Trichoderma viride]